MYRPPLWYLQRIELFSDLNDKEIEALVLGIYHGEYDGKYILYTPHEQTENTYILKEGEVTLYKIIDGKQVILDILKPGAIFGNIGFHASEGQDHYAEVTQHSFVCTLPKDFFLQLLTRRPDIAAKAFDILAKRIAQYQAQISLLSSLDARDRILATIRILDEKEKQSILPPILRRPTKITHEKLANMTGLTRETVTKQLKELSEDECITATHKHIRLTEKGRDEIAKLF